MAVSDISKRIVYTDETGGITVVFPSMEYLKSHSIEELAAKDVPSGLNFVIVDENDIPKDRTFRDAWSLINDTIYVKMNIAKEIAHKSRRYMREKEFLPHDEIIAKRIPGVSEQQAEAARQAIRDKYAVVQKELDAAETPEELKQILEDAKTE